MFGHGEDGGGGRCGGGPGAAGVGDPLPAQAGRRGGPLVPPIRRQQPWVHPPTALPHRATAASRVFIEAVVVNACKWSNFRKNFWLQDRLTDKRLPVTSCP